MPDSVTDGGCCLGFRISGDAQSRMHAVQSDREFEFSPGGEALDSAASRIPQVWPSGTEQCWGPHAQLMTTGSRAWDPLSCVARGQCPGLSGARFLQCQNKEHKTLLLSATCISDFLKRFLLHLHLLTACRPFGNRCGQRECGHGTLTSLDRQEERGQSCREHSLPPLPSEGGLGAGLWFPVMPAKVCEGGLCPGLGQHVTCAQIPARSLLSSRS